MSLGEFSWEKRFKNTEVVSNRKVMKPDRYQHKNNKSSNLSKSLQESKEFWKNSQLKGLKEDREQQSKPLERRKES